MQRLSRHSFEKRILPCGGVKTRLSELFFGVGYIDEKEFYEQKMGHREQHIVTRISSCERANVGRRRDKQWWDFRRCYNIQWGQRAKQRNRQSANGGPESAKSSAAATGPSKSKSITGTAKSATVATG